MILELWDSFVSQLRSFFKRKGYLEVSTPIMLRFPNLDSNVEPIEVHVLYGAKKQRMWLQTSPEYSMKKLLARYRRNIFQITKVFRNGELGKLHRPEFHMLEWYKVGVTYRDLIEEIKELLSELFHFRSFEERTVAEVFREFTGRELSTKRTELIDVLRSKGLNYEENEEWETLFYRVFIEIERKMGKDVPLFLTNFPPELCALAKVENGTAQRFELFIKGVEVANGWTEETNPDEVRRRLEKEAKKRYLPIDEAFIKANEELPPCAGCSIGVDRLFMLWLGKEKLSDVELFSDELL